MEETVNENFDIMSDVVVKKIIFLIRKKTGFSIKELDVKSRHRPLVIARQMVMFFLDKHTNYSLAIIGSIFNRKHCTVLHAKKTINNLKETDRGIRSLFTEIEDEINIIKNKNNITRYSVFLKVLEISGLEEDEKNNLIEEYATAI